jgi:hypothetical protein
VESVAYKKGIKCGGKIPKNILNIFNFISCHFSVQTLQCKKKFKNFAHGQKQPQNTKTAFFAYF